MNEALNNIIKSFIERLMENDWLDSFSKDACKDKVLQAIPTTVILGPYLCHRSMLSLHELLIQILLMMIVNWMNIMKKYLNTCMTCCSVSIAFITAYSQFLR